MRFLLDVNVGSTIAAALRAAGHDVARAAQSDPRAEDPDVLARAVGEDRVLVTYDRDFGELIYYRSAGLPPAIITSGTSPMTLRHWSSGSCRCWISNDCGAT